MDSEIKINKDSVRFKYFHRTIYVFLVLTTINLPWNIFSKTKNSPKHFFMGIIVIIGFSLFYFIVKNFKRYIIRKKNIKSKFFDSSALVPFVYLFLIYFFLFIFNISAYLMDNANETTAKKNETNISITEDLINETYDNTYENDFRNLIFFINVSMCKYAVYPLSVEQPGLMKKFYKENIIDKKSTATSIMILISLFSSFLMQLSAILISEKIIYRLVRKKKKKSSNNKNKILTQPV